MSCTSLAILLTALLPSVRLCASESDYLNARQIVIIGGSSFAIALLGAKVSDVSPGKHSLITGPILADASIQRRLAGSYYPGKTNFLDNHTGSLATPVAAGLLLTASDLAWSGDQNKKTAAQDLFLFTSGVMANKGITDLIKGIVARPRPFLAQLSDSTAKRSSDDYAVDHNSFYSGHASSSFFAATYLNKRIRSLMRLRMSPESYRNWRWLPPALTYGWATFVAWTRIEAYRHYFSDVTVGALAGYLVAEVFYRYAAKIQITAGSASSTPRTLTVTIRF